MKAPAKKPVAAKKPAAKASKAIVIADEDEPVLMRGGYKQIGSSDSRAVTSSSNSSSSSSAAAYPVEEIDETVDDDDEEDGATHMTPLEDDGEDVNLTPFLFGEQRLIRTDEGETWLLNGDGSRGEWAGMYDAETGTLDETAENPFEE